MSRSSRIIFVGNLPMDIREPTVRELFSEYGRIVRIDLKFPNKLPAHAFIEFEEASDAEDARRGRNGFMLDGNPLPLLVHFTHAAGRRSSSTGRNNSGSQGARDEVSRSSDNRVLVTGLPHSATRHDLRDHMRRAGNVCFSQVFDEGTSSGQSKKGIVEYTNYDDMRDAINELDDSEFKNDSGQIRLHVKKYDSVRARSRSRSRQTCSSEGERKRRSRSPSKSPDGKSSHHSMSRSKSMSSRSRSGSMVHSASR